MKEVQATSAEDNGLKALEICIAGQLLCERIEEMPPNLNRKKIKNLTNQLLKELEPLTRQYNKIYLSDEEVSREVVYEYDRFIKHIARLDLMQKVELSQMHEAAMIDKKTMISTAHRVIRKGMLKLT